MSCTFGKTTKSSTNSPCCYAELPNAVGSSKARQPKSRNLWLLLAALAGWTLVYFQLERASEFVSFHVLQLHPSSPAGKAVSFFFYEAPKVLLLLSLIVFAMTLLRSFFTPEQTRAVLARNGGPLAHVSAALLGIVTPFCSCSAVSLFIGFLTAGVPLGVTFAFLVSAPMVNEIALGLLLSLFGWKIAGLYLGTGLAVAIASGWVIGALKMESGVEPWVYDELAVTTAIIEPKTWSDRIRIGWKGVADIVGRVWIYMLLGIGIGAVIHGYVPQSFMASVMGRHAWWSVPVAVMAGVPIYSNAAAILPIVQALLGKGAALGTSLAFMMSVVALSLPEMIILRRVLRPRLIATFVSVVTAGILLVGYLFNFLLS